MRGVSIILIVIKSIFKSSFVVVFCGVWGFGRGDKKVKISKCAGVKPRLRDWGLLVGVLWWGCGYFEEFKILICD